jgi:hypothetical protein
MLLSSFPNFFFSTLIFYCFFFIVISVGLGGLNALSWFITIKIKLFLLFLFIAGAIFVGYKVAVGKGLISGLFGGCGHSISDFSGFG